MLNLQVLLKNFDQFSTLKGYSFKKFSVTANTGHIPVIDISSLYKEEAQEIRQACCDSGFFYISNYAISEEVLSQVYQQSHQFFKLPIQKKNLINVSNSGIANRGYFPMGFQQYQQNPDHFQGFTMRVNHPPDHPFVLQKANLFGQNQFPADLPQFQPIMEKYYAELNNLGLTLLKGISLSLGKQENYLEKTYYSRETNHTMKLLHYPPMDKSIDQSVNWGIGQHTDWGIITILKQDQVGGLQVKNEKFGWILATPIPQTFICNIGNMLETLTGGEYKSTLHRVQNNSNQERYSYPFFFDPYWDSKFEPLYDIRTEQRRVQFFSGTFGQFIDMMYEKHVGSGLKHKEQSSSTQ